MKNKKNWLKLALWMCGFGSFSDGIAVPLTNLIMEDFPNTSLFLRNMVLSGSTLPALAGAVITGALVSRADKRKLLLFGSICFLIGGVGGAFSPNVKFLIFTRMLDGFSDGVLSVAAMSAITEIYTDENERSGVIGGYNAVSALFGLITSFLAGMIAVYSWRCAFLLNGITVTGIVLLMIFAPKMPPIKVEPSKTLNQTHRNHGLYAYLLLFFVFGSLITQTYYLADIYVAEKSIGTSIQTGSLVSVLTIANFLANALFGSLYKRLKKAFLPFIFFVSSLSLLIMSLANSFMPAAFAFALAGASNALGVDYFGMLVSENASAAGLGRFMSLYTAVLYLNGFASPYVSTLAKIFFGITQISKVYLISAAFCAAVAAVQMCLVMKKRENNSCL